MGAADCDVAADTDGAAAAFTGVADADVALVCPADAGLVVLLRATPAACLAGVVVAAAAVVVAFAGAAAAGVFADSAAFADVAVFAAGFLMVALVCLEGVADADAAAAAAADGNDVGFAPDPAEGDFAAALVAAFGVARPLLFSAFARPPFI